MNPLAPLLLAAASPSPAPGTPDPDIVNAGWWGFLGLLFLSIAVFFLWKSMNKQLTRVTFDEVPVDAGPKPSAESVESGPTTDPAEVAADEQ